MLYRHSTPTQGQTITDSFSSPSGVVSVDSTSQFTPSQPSTWPAPPATFDNDFLRIFSTIVDETITKEFENVLSDIRNCSREGLKHRGHVIAVALLCAIDAVATYGYDDASIKNGRVKMRYTNFITNHFPADYRQYAEKIYLQYRNASAHGWHFLEVSITPDNTPLQDSNGHLSVGLLNLFQALKTGINDFVSTLNQNPNLQSKTIIRYTQQRDRAL